MSSSSSIPGSGLDHKKEFIETKAIDPELYPPINFPSKIVIDPYSQECLRKGEAGFLGQPGQRYAVVGFILGDTLHLVFRPGYDFLRTPDTELFSEYVISNPKNVGIVHQETYNFAIKHNPELKNTTKWVGLSCYKAGENSFTWVNRSTFNMTTVLFNKLARACMTFNKDKNDFSQTLFDRSDNLARSLDEPYVMMIKDAVEKILKNDAVLSEGISNLQQIQSKAKTIVDCYSFAAKDEWRELSKNKEAIGLALQRTLYIGSGIIRNEDQSIPYQVRYLSRIKEVFSLAKEYDIPLDINFIPEEFRKNKNNGTAIQEACRQGYLDLVKFLLTKGAKIDILNENKESLLFYAMQSKNINLLQYLIDQGLNVNHVNSYGETVLDKAIESVDPDFKTIFLLWNAAGKLSKLPEFGRRITVEDFIKQAIVHGEEKIIDEILDLDDGEYNQSLLFHAVKYENITAIKKLLEKRKFNLGAVIEDKSVLHCAIEKNNLKIIKLLVEEYKIIPRLDNPSDLIIFAMKNAQDENIVKYLLSRDEIEILEISEFRKALEVATKESKVDFFNMLIEKPNILDSKLLDELMRSASATGNLSIGKILISKHPSEQAMIQALAIAAGYGHQEMIQLLLGLEGIKYDFARACDAAATYGNVASLKMLLAESKAGWRIQREGVVVNAVDAGYDEIVSIIIKESAASPEELKAGLFSAVKNKNEKLVTMLLESKIENMQTEASKIELMHYAAKNSNEKILAMVLDEKININAQNAEESNALILAASANQLESVDLLLSKGAVVTSTTEQQDEDPEAEISFATWDNVLSKWDDYAKSGVDVTEETKSIQTEIFQKLFQNNKLELNSGHCKTTSSLAVQLGNADILSAVLIRFSFMKDQEIEYQGLMSSLLKSAIESTNAVEIIKVLVNHGAKITDEIIDCAVLEEREKKREVGKEIVVPLLLLTGKSIVDLVIEYKNNITISKKLEPLYLEGVSSLYQEIVDKIYIENKTDEGHALREFCDFIYSKNEEAVRSNFLSVHPYISDELLADMIQLAYSLRCNKICKYLILMKTQISTESETPSAAEIFAEANRLVLNEKIMKQLFPEKFKKEKEFKKMSPLLAKSMFSPEQATFDISSPKNTPKKRFGAGGD